MTSEEIPEKDLEGHWIAARGQAAPYIPAGPGVHKSGAKDGMSAGAKMRRMTSSSRRHPTLTGVRKSAVNAGGRKASKCLPRKVGVDESDDALTLQPVLECTGRTQKAGEMWASKLAARGEQMVDGLYSRPRREVNIGRRPCRQAASTEGHRSGGGGRAPKMLARSGLMVARSAFVLQGDEKLASSVCRHSADTGASRRGRNDGRGGGTKTAGGQREDR
ncbi:hypothetical protein C8R44DRAFT_852868 [Mycena epipterygia]|nr:hypothetical protein C8R44DRAFT_852868 [Mycena epipterygia]